MIMHAALSSVNFGLNSKPSLLKNSIDRFRSRTGKLTKISRERFCAMTAPQVGVGFVVIDFHQRPKSSLRAKLRARSRGFRLSTLLLTIEHPLNAKGIRQHPKGGAPE